jgi:predicted Fe-Mo cluster-binding NifX family protein
MENEKHLSIVIPVYGTRISPRIDCANSFFFIKIKNRQIVEKENLKYLSHNTLEKFNMITKLHPNVLICDGITNIYKNILEEKDIVVIPWVTGETDEILSKYLSGELEVKKSNNDVTHNDGQC